MGWQILKVVVFNNLGMRVNNHLSLSFVLLSKRTRRVLHSMPLRTNSNIFSSSFQPSSAWQVLLVTQYVLYLLPWVLAFTQFRSFQVPPSETLILPLLLLPCTSLCPPSMSQQVSEVIFSILQGSLATKKNLISLPTSLGPWKPVRTEHLWDFISPGWSGRDTDLPLFNHLLWNTTS